MVTAADGGRFRVTRLGRPGNQPVVLVPGTFDNRRLYLWPGGGGLAVVLAQAGFDVWVVERRGVGGIERVAGVRAGWEEALRQDLPAMQRLIAKSTAVPVFWVGHSFGGVLVARAVAETLDRDRVAGLVLVSAAVDIALLTTSIATTVLSSRRWGEVFPARALRLGPEDEPGEALADAIEWAGAERRHSCISALVAAVAEVPVLALASPLDLIAPPARCRHLARACGSRDMRVQSLSRRQGFALDHTHASPLLHPRAAHDVFPFLRDWLITRSATQNTLIAAEPADPAPRRHHLEFTADLDADIDTVFDVLTDRWAELWPVRQQRARDGLIPGVPNGLGCIRAQRALGIWPIHEQITVHQRPHLIEYRTIRGPVRRHRGRIRLRTSGPTTHLDYRFEFDTPPWIPGALLAAALRHTWSHYSLPRLHTLCTHAAGPPQHRPQTMTGRDLRGLQTPASSTASATPRRQRHWT
ncbi:alpha/beta fold hydrolase [Nocardia gamkensis]|uniref:Alpha/beta fold hydrolase n=1 Tax=Nocardia gamkensis TaxID=352869 RepID=A0A7X6L122_9NOCA|nr:alpha/beta fold hydrolase [Nocardia gamkensis]